MKSIKLLACVILAAVSTGCATVELSTEGISEGGSYSASGIEQQMAKDSELGGE
jgi:hypothetical protein